MRFDTDTRVKIIRASGAGTPSRNAAPGLLLLAMVDTAAAVRGKRYVYIEAGHAARNIYLQAIPLGLGTVTVGAFSDRKVKQILDLPENEAPLYLMPVGKTR